MIKHIILWNFQEGKGSEEDKLQIKNGLEGLKNKVEAAKDKAVKDLGDVGEDVKGRIENSKAYTKGRYLVYSISDDGENIKNSFEEMFNK